VLGGVLAAYPTLATPRLRPLEAALGVAAVVALGVALGGRQRLLGVALAALAGQVVALEELRPPAGAVLVLCAAGLLLLGELASFAISLRAVELVARRVVRRRGAYLAAVAAGGAAAAAAVLLAARIAIGGGLASAALGVGAIVVLIGATSALTRSHRHD
jgi:hypothetical protein